MVRTWTFIGGFFLGLASMSILGLWGIGQFPTLGTSGVTSLPLELGATIDTLTNVLDEQGIQGTIGTKYTIIDEILAQGYYDQERIDHNEMIENSLKGYVDAIGDPYTTYLTATENTLFDEEMQGAQDFEGIGAIVTKKKDGVMVEEVLKGMPAFKAGVQPLDIIFEIDGEMTQTMGINEAVQHIRGPKGSEVVLTIYRESTTEILDITVVRDAVYVPSVREEIVKVAEDNVLYLEIAVMGEDTKKAVQDIFTQYRNEVQGIILDLRGNGGGHLPVAVDVTSFFLPQDTLVTTAKYTLWPDEIYRSKGFGIMENMPVVVLIDGMSASASEIVAAALQEEAGAILIGTQTFGKGSVQTLHEIDDGSSLKYTIGKWYTPSGANVDREGIIPDVVVEFDREAYLADETDTQLEQALQEVQVLIDQRY